jgi:hypothetical protein
MLKTRPLLTRSSACRLCTGAAADAGVQREPSATALAVNMVD